MPTDDLCRQHAARGGNHDTEKDFSVGTVGRDPLSRGREGRAVNVARQRKLAGLWSYEMVVRRSDFPSFDGKPSNGKEDGKVFKGLSAKETHIRKKGVTILLVQRGSRGQIPGEGRRRQLLAETESCIGINGMPKKTAAERGYTLQNKV